MSDDRYDDGLVHGHGWAQDKPQPALGRATAALSPAASDDDRYDDGLVHAHAWASLERGGPTAPPILPAE